MVRQFNEVHVHNIFNFLIKLCIILQTLLHIAQEVMNILKIVPYQYIQVLIYVFNSCLSKYFMIE